MQKKWLIKSPPDDTDTGQLRSVLKIDRTLAGLLLQRGISGYESARDFFRPSLDALHDPFLMHDMDRAADRLARAIRGKERILLFGDYDVDGTTAVSMMYLFLRELNPEVYYYIPDRYAEGYGLSDQGIDHAVEKNCTLMISLDCGIRSVEKIARAMKHGIDFIVCDHHQPGPQLPDCIILDPKKEQCHYPFSELSGCGVGFKLLDALCRKYLPGEQSRLFTFLDFLAVSIGADLVPVSGENRILSYYGLRRINEQPRTSFTALLEVAERALPLTLTDVVFVIAPRINAAGRIRSGKYAVEMMTSEDGHEIRQLAAEINDDNLERRKLDAEITAEALALIEADQNFHSRRSTVVFQDNWHKGVIGIVASRLIEVHFRPTIVFTRQDDHYTGSARTVNDFDIHAALCHCEDLIVQFGGHTHAAGLTVHADKLEAFCERFEAVVAEHLLPEDHVPRQEADYKLNFDELFMKEENRMKLPRFKRILDQFEPFGPGNMKPLFLSENVFATDQRILKDKHLKLSVVQPDADLCIEAIGFNMADKAELVASGLPFDMIYTLESNTWNNKTTLQLNIKDIRSTC